MDLLGQTTEPCCEKPVVSVDTLMSRLRDKKLRLEGDLAIVNESLAALEANPEMARILNLIHKASRSPY